MLISKKHILTIFWIFGQNHCLRFRISTPNILQCSIVFDIRFWLYFLFSEMLETIFSINHCWTQGRFLKGGNRGNYALQGRGFPMFFCFKRVDFLKFFAPAESIGTAGEYFRSNSSKFRKKAALMFTFFVKNTKIFVRAFGAPMFYYLYVKITPPPQKKAEESALIRAPVAVVKIAVPTQIDRHTENFSCC